MNITLTRDKITSNKLNNDGFLEEFVDEQNINFSDKKQLLKDEEIKKLIYKEFR